jgi:hypothetical protein
MWAIKLMYNLSFLFYSLINFIEIHVAAC